MNDDNFLFIATLLLALTVSTIESFWAGSIVMVLGITNMYLADIYRILRRVE